MHNYMYMSHRGLRACTVTQFARRRGVPSTMKSKPYHVSPAVQKWEEENYKRLMERKVKGARSTIAGRTRPANPAGATPRSTCCDCAGAVTSLHGLLSCT